MAVSIERVSSIMAATAQRWLDLAANVPADVLERPAVDGEWSAVDCLRHLLSAERHVFPGRIEEFLEGVEELSAVDPSRIPPLSEQTPRELADAFARAREENLQRVSALRPEDLERTARSRRFGMVTLGDMVQQWAIHDLDHLTQADRALLQSLVVDAGPLRPMYAHLDLEATRAEVT